MLSSYRRTTIAAAAPNPRTSPGVSLTRTDTSERDEEGVRDGRRGRRVATTTSTASDASTANAGALGRERPPDGDLEPVGDVSEHGSRAVAERPRDVARPAERGVQVRRAPRRARRRPRPRPAMSADVRPAGVRDQRGVAGEQDEEPAAVRAEAVARDGDEGEGADRDP